MFSAENRGRLEEVINTSVDKAMKRGFSELYSHPSKGQLSEMRTPEKRRRVGDDGAGPSDGTPVNAVAASPSPTRAVLRSTGLGNILTAGFSLGQGVQSGQEVCSVRMVEPLPRNADEDCSVLLPELRAMLGNRNAVFKSQMQSDVAATVRRSEANAIVIMPTAAGKSISFLLPCFMDNPGSATIIVVPLVALKEELFQRCRGFGISAVMWTPGMSRATTTDQSRTVYLISAEHLDMGSFSTFVRQLNGKKVLTRIVVDEAHLSVLWSDFRPCLQRMQYTLQSLKCQVPTYLFSATIPPRDTANVLMAHGVGNAIVFRMPSVRKNVGIHVTYCRAVPTRTVREQMHAAVTRCLTKICRSEEAKSGVRVLVYAQRIDDLVRLRAQFHVNMDALDVAAIEVLIYTGKMSTDRRTKTHQDWTAELPPNKVRVMLCTNAFGTGIDSDRVVAVIHFGGSNSIADYAQEIGRAGRNGLAATALLVYSDHFASRIMTTMMGATGSEHGRLAGMEDVPMASVARASQFSEFRNWAETDNVCRKNALYAVLDGTPPGMCLYDATSSNCDVCNRVNAEGTGGDDLDVMDVEQLLPPVEVGTPQATPRDGASRRTPGVLVFGGRGGAGPSLSIGGARQPDTGTGARSDPITPVSVRRNLLSELESEGAENIVSGATGDDEDIPLIYVLTTNATNVVRATREIVEQIRGKCPHCLVRKNMLVEHERCPLNMYCGICCSTKHRRGQCPCRRMLQGKCVRCGLSSVRGVNLHDYQSFGKMTCPFKICQDICIILYHVGYEQDSILLPLMNSEQRQKLLVDVRLRDGASMMKEFMGWLLLNNDHLQHTITIFLQWARRCELTINPPGLWITA